MGLLDDAIREHLDLKRRRGADPAEIERAEREALGPVRREPIASDEFDETSAPAAAMDAPSSGAEIPPQNHAGATPAGETYGPEYGDDETAEDEDWDDYEDEDLEEDDGLEPRHADPRPDALEEAHRAHEAGPEPPAVPAPHDDPGATRAFPVEPPTEGEDVLEETPDFLHDTPDHDRLWFEQRPPKDFDFDE